MKLLQWNIWYKEDIKNILKTIKDINPDVVCLQELAVNYPHYNQGIDTPVYIAEGLGFNYFAKEAQRSNVEGAEYMLCNGIFSRYPIVSSDFVYIQEPLDPSLKDPDYSKEGRVYVQATIDVDGKALKVGTVHMSYTHKFEMTPAKELEANKLLSLIQQKQSAYIITGDFNLPADSSVIAEIQKTLINAGPALTENTWTTKPFSYNGFEANTLDWRLDYCFATPDMQVKSTEVVKTDYSDHLPILIDFSF